MPSTLVHVAFGAIVATALLGSAFDRRAVALALALVAAADLDAVVGLVLAGAHRSVGHTLLLPLGAAVAVALDTRGRERLPWLGAESWLAPRFEGNGIRVAWVCVVTFAVAAIGLDLVMGGRFGGVNLFYPLHDQFYQLDGHAFYSTREGFVQTFVTVTREQTGHGARTVVDAGQKGTTAQVHISNPVDPSRGAEPPDVERIVPLAAAGWQLWTVLTGALVLAARLWEER
ncbi:MAG: metal-dependent hydrolase [Haloarculaceae archaeon]